MIALDKTTTKLQAFLGAAAATTSPTVIVTFWECSKEGVWSKKPATVITALAGATETDILAAPQQSFVRSVASVNISNVDTAAVTVIVVIDNNGTNAQVCRELLQINDTLELEFPRPF